jgi:hypothetical protein
LSLLSSLFFLDERALEFGCPFGHTYAQRLVRLSQLNCAAIHEEKRHHEHAERCSDQPEHRALHCSRRTGSVQTAKPDQLLLLEAHLLNRRAHAVHAGLFTIPKLYLNEAFRPRHLDNLLQERQRRTRLRSELLDAPLL